MGRRLGEEEGLMCKVEGLSFYLQRGYNIPGVTMNLPVIPML